MTADQILLYNKLIAEFLGVNYYLNDPLMKINLDGDHDQILFYCEWHPDIKLDENCNIVAWHFMPHESWCQLMPVINKIRIIEKEASEKMQAKLIKFRLDGLSIFDASIFTPIEWVYTEVVRFIEWYNLNKGK